jgi:hypothetical protein
MITLSYVFGFLGILLTVIIYQQKSRKGLLISKLISDAVWFCHYFFLGAYSGAVIALIGATRELVFINRDKKWGKSILWLPVFIVISIVCTIFTWKDIFCIFTCFASILSVVSFYIGIPKISRILSYPISGCMLTYDIANLSIAGIINEVFTLTSSLIGYFRIDRKNNSTKLKEDKNFTNGDFNDEKR